MTTSYDHIHNITWVMWKIFVGDVIDKIYDVITFISKYLYFKKSEVAFFDDIIKILTTFIITTYKDSKKS